LAHQSHSFYVTMRRRSRSTLFPYTTLFRSVRPAAGTPSRQGGRGATAPPAAPRRGAVAGWKEYSGLGGEAARSTPSPCALIPEGGEESGASPRGPRRSPGHGRNGSPRSGEPATTILRAAGN